MGGVETVVQEMSELLVAKGVQVTVYSVDLGKGLPRRQRVNGVLVKRFIPLLGDPFYFPEPCFVASLRRERADIIHVHNIHILLPFLVALFKHGKQKLLLQPHYHRFGQSSFRHSLLKLYTHALNSVVFPRADITVANSVYEENILREDFPEHGDFVLVPEGIDVDEIRRVKRKPDEPRRILYVGALRGYKNIDKVLEGFALLVKEENTGFRLVIVGGGPQRAFLASHAHDLGVDKFVEWKHDLSREQLLCEYAKASALVLLSPLESFSRVVYEGLLMGVPVVVLDYGATGYLAKAGFAEGVSSLRREDIANALLRAVTKTYPRISEEENTFLSWEEYSRRVVSIYSSLLEGN
jgi:glycosyltransferase involved in cell wall biosynthesis